jgi:GNAT superfamily N-acetyltransferase
VDDAAAMAAVHVASWSAAYRGIVADEVLDAMDVDDRAAAWRDRLPHIRAWVAERDGEIVGIASIAPCELKVLYVHPDHWRSGAGRALARAALDELRAQGCAEVVLWAFEANHAAHAFYAAMGFTPDGARGILHGAPEIRLRAPVTSGEEVRPG